MSPSSKSLRSTFSFDLSFSLEVTIPPSQSWNKGKAWKHPSIHFGTLIHSNQPWSGFHCDFWTIIPRFGWVRKEDPIKAPCHGTVEVKNNLKKIHLQLSPSFHVFPPFARSPPFFSAGANVENQLRFHRSRQCQTWHPCCGGRWVRPIPAVAGKVSPFSRANDQRRSEVPGPTVGVAEDLWEAHFCRWDLQIPRDGKDSTSHFYQSKI